LYVVAMLLTLVYGGEHYVSDILVGYVYAAAAVWGVNSWFRRRDSVAAPTEGG
jgi:membrane-associated phospholipid phosphatase